MGADPLETGDRARSGEIWSRLGGVGSIPGLGDFLPDLRLLPWVKEGDRKVIAGRGERGGQGGSRIKTRGASAGALLVNYIIDFMHSNLYFIQPC